MATLRRTTSENPDFERLVALLDADLAKRDGEEHAFYDQFNAIQTLDHVVVLTVDEKAVACGAFKAFDAASFEVKRMYTREEARGKGYAAAVLVELEAWASELRATRMVLETGKRQPEAVAFYKAKGYALTPNYGPYVGMENSLCFQKKLG